jgi:hypothetical protein
MPYSSYNSLFANAEMTEHFSLSDSGDQNDDCSSTSANETYHDAVSEIYYDALSEPYNDALSEPFNEDLTSVVNIKIINASDGVELDQVDMPPHLQFAIVLEQLRELYPEMLCLVGWNWIPVERTDTPCTVSLFFFSLTPFFFPSFLHFFLPSV